MFHKVNTLILSDTVRIRLAIVLVLMAILFAFAALSADSVFAGGSPMSSGG